MTTPTTSRVSDAQREAFEKFLRYAPNFKEKYLERDGRHPDYYGSHIIQASWEGWKAALASLGDVVAVNEVQEITRGNAGWASCFEGDEQFVRWSDLSAILNRGGK